VTNLQVGTGVRRALKDHFDRLPPERQKQIYESLGTVRPATAKRRVRWWRWLVERWRRWRKHAQVPTLGTGPAVSRDDSWGFPRGRRINSKSGRPI
jgi:hypothetical protein